MKKPRNITPRHKTSPKKEDTSSPPKFNQFAMTEGNYMYPLNTRYPDNCYDAMCFNPSNVERTIYEEAGSFADITIKMEILVPSAAAENNNTIEATIRLSSFLEAARLHTENPNPYIIYEGTIYQVNEISQDDNISNHNYLYLTKVTIKGRAVPSILKYKGKVG